MRSQLRGAALASATLCACFGDPPGVDNSSADGSDTTASTATTAASADASPSSDTTSSSDPTASVEVTGSSASGETTSGTPGWCAMPEIVRVPPHQPDGFDTTFHVLAMLGNTLWVAGSNVQNGFFSPAAWPFDGSAIGPMVSYPMDRNFEAVSFLDFEGGPPRVVFNEFNVRALVLDDPTQDGFAEVGEWFPQALASGFGEVVRTADGTLWGAGFGTNIMGWPEWRIATSGDQGANWGASAFSFSITETQPSIANALAVTESGLIVVAGFASDTTGARHWAAISFMNGDEIGEPDMMPDGTAFAVQILGDDVFVGGQHGTKGEIRHAVGLSPFEPMTDLDDPVVDLAVARDQIVVALSSQPGLGFVLSACEDPSAGSSCWHKLHEEASPATGELTGNAIVVDGDVIWVAGDLRDPLADPPAGALFRIDCSD